MLRRHHPIRRTRRIVASAVAIAVLWVVAAAPALAEGPGYDGNADALVVTVVSTDGGPAGGLTPAPTLGDAPVVGPEGVGGPGQVRAATFVRTTATRPAARPTSLRLEARGFLAGSALDVVVPGGHVQVHADRFGALDSVVAAASRRGTVRVRGLDADLDTRALQAAIPTGTGAGADPRPLLFGGLAAVTAGLVIAPLVRRRRSSTP